MTDPIPTWCFAPAVVWRGDRLLLVRPARISNKGVLHLAAETGAPIVPLRLHCARAIPPRRWDRKRVPPPFQPPHRARRRPDPVVTGQIADAVEPVSAGLG